ncbi:type II toxin-antitoxin system HicB family antitoxin [Paradevosia shaoguanensis]|uniref:type II toxin-antitoxin system HicB family antitoxin n=1 Tax=Paradevosia shaoguanensis TaxID=1335043 RepID=UPI003C773228
MHYLAQFTPDEGGWLVQFPDVPGAVSAGKDLAEAIENAQDALEVMLLTMANDRKALPEPASAKAKPAKDQHLIPVSAGTSAKLAFIRAFDESGLSLAEMAARLGKAKNEVARMRDPYHQTKIQALEAGLKVLGKRLVVLVEAA